MECTIKAALARLCTGTKILIPNSVRPTLISTSIVLKIWLWILVWIVTGSSNTVFTPSVIEDLLVFVLRNAEVMVIIWLMEWIESGFVLVTIGLEYSCEHKETGTRFSIVLILEDTVFWIRQ